MSATGVDAALVEGWALAYLAHFASSAENLRRVLRRRLWRRVADKAGREAGAALIDSLVARYVAAGLLDDRAYATGRARARHRRGAPLSAIRADLAAKGIDAATTAAAVQALRDAAPDPELAAACAFARRRRLGPFRRGIADRPREVAAFARAGFGRREAEAVLACSDPEALAALERDGLV